MVKEMTFDEKLIDIINDNIEIENDGEKVTGLDAISIDNTVKLIKQAIAAELPNDEDSDVFSGTLAIVRKRLGIE